LQRECDLKCVFHFSERSEGNVEKTPELVRSLAGYTLDDIGCSKKMQRDGLAM